MGKCSMVFTPDDVRTMVTVEPLAAERLDLERARAVLQRLALTDAVPQTVRDVCLEICFHLGECATALRRESYRLTQSQKESTC